MLVKSDITYPTSKAMKIDLGNGTYALVDEENYDEINSYRWYAKKSFHCWYACRKDFVDGKYRIIRMHRQIARTPADMVCHHINKISLDNRLLNLLNMTQYDHKIMHSWR